MLTVDGLASGLDTSSIIEGLLSIRQRQLDQLGVRKEAVLAEQTSFKGVEARLVSLRASLSRLTRTQDGLFRSRIAETSDENIATAAATSKAATGNYVIRVQNLAQRHQLASQGFGSADSGLTQGDFTLQVGGGEEVTIAVDDSNNTLQGLANSINTADVNVNASVVFDGSAYRMLLTSAKTGAANEVTITNNLDNSGGGLTRPDFSGPAVQDAADATITVGSGAGALTVTGADNQIDDVFEGVALQLTGADPNRDISLSIQRDTEPAAEAVNDFVSGFNDLMSYIDQESQFNSESEIANVLLGNRDVITIQQQVRSAALDVVAGLGGPADRLSTIGISVNDAGQLTLNSTKLEDALAGRIEGVSEDDLQSLFALSGKSDNPGIQFLGGSTRTKDSITPYEVDITRAAERAAITGNRNLRNNTTIDSSNNQLEITLDATTATVTLADGTYGRDELAQLVQDTINESGLFKNARLTAGVEDRRLVLTSESYGSDSEVTVVGGSALDAVRIAEGETDSGEDVAGAFLVDGVREEAKGSGRLLTGNRENDHTADIRLRVTLSGSQLQSGADGGLTVSRGVAARLDQAIGSMLDPVEGRMKNINDAFTARIDSIDESVERTNALFEQQQESLVRQFAALERTISDLQSTGAFLTGQLGGFAGLSIG